MRQKRLLTVCMVILLIPLIPQGVQSTENSGQSLEEKLDRLEEELETLKREKNGQTEEQGNIPDPKEAQRNRVGAPHQASPVGSYGGIMNPDISVVADVQALFSSNTSDPNRNKIRVKEVELAFQGYLYPGIRADVIPALEMEYSDDEVQVNIDLEEAYLTVFQIPYISEHIALELQAGRKLMNLGRLNSVHPHHWPFADTPLVLANFFGEHPWFDDGIQGGLTIPNPWDFYLKTIFGFWNGKRLGHNHGEETEEHDHHSHGETVSWDGHVYLSRTTLGIPFGRKANSLIGYSIARDEAGATTVHQGDLTLTWRLPGTFQRIRWQNSFFAAHIETGDLKRYGGYSLLQIDLTKYWQGGYRYDHAQSLDHHQGGDEWAASGFLTYFFTHSLYLRGQYRFRRMLDNIGEHNGYLQLVFGLGPHSHKLEN